MTSLDHDLTMRLMDLEAENNLLRHEQKLLYLDLVKIAKALGVKEEWGGSAGDGYSVERMLDRIRELNDD